jgi:glycosyltransferase involved in cell wall biosynthesis
LKIVHLLGWYFPDSVGGTEVYVSALCERLRDVGHDLRIAAPTVRDDVPRSYEHGGVPVFRYVIPSTPTRDEAMHRVPVRGARALHEWLAAERPDILHLHSIATGVGLPEIREARRLGIRVIATCHLPGLGYMCRSGELMQCGSQPCDGVVEPSKCASCNLVRLDMPTPLARACAALPPGVSARLADLPGRAGTVLGMASSVAEYVALQQEMFDLLEAFVVLNQTARRMLTTNGSPAAKIVINRLGLSQRQITPKAGPEVRPTKPPVRFGYIGRLHQSKGLMGIVDAVRKIPEHIAFTLEIRGPVLDDLTRSFVAALRSQTAADLRIRIEAAVAPDQMPAQLRELDVLVCPSILFENGPTVALEANAAGTPVIGSHVGNLPEIIDDRRTGRLIAPGDVESWASAITEIAVNPSGTVDVWRRNLQQPRTMDDVARDYLALYAA